MVISYSCFHFGPKYYRPAASDGHCHNRLLRRKLSALTANVGPKRQPDHSRMQLGPINGKHTDKFTFLLDINNVQSLYYLAIHLCILYAFITQATRHNKKFELLFTRRPKAYSSFGSVVYLKIGVFTLSKYTNTKFSIWIA